MSNADHPSPAQPRHAIILAAGESKRTRPLTAHRPKPLIPLLGKPLIAHILDSLVGIVDRVTLVVGYRAEMIEANFGSQYAGMALHYVRQSQMNGTAGALLAVGALAEPFLLLYGDNLIAREDVLSVSRHVNTLAGLRVDDARAFGILQIKDDAVSGILEKPADPPPDALANPGIFHFSADAYALTAQIRPSPRGELELTDLIELLAANHTVGYHICRGYWIPVGTPWEALTAAQFLLAMQRNEACAIADGAHIHPDSRIEGSSRVAVGAHIAAGARIRDSLIGPGAVIEAGAIVERSVLEAGAQISGAAHVSDSVIGAGAYVGAHADVQAAWLDDLAHLADRTQIAAALFSELRPVAVTNNLLSREQLATRGAIIARGVQAGGLIAAGSILNDE